MVVAIVIGICGALVLGAGYWFALRAVFRRTTERERAAFAVRRAMEAVDDIFYGARIRMEEAVGRRQPGERRFGDDLRGSWRDW
jgi:hypothetical protein